MSGARFLNIFIGMISAMILVRIYSISEYGIYSQALIIGNVITTIFSLSVSNSCNYFIAKAKNIDEEKIIIRHLLTITIFQCIVAFFTTVLLAPFISKYFTNTSLKIAIIIISILPIYNIIRGVFEVSLISIRKTKIVILSQIFISIMCLCVNIIFIFIHKNIYYLLLVTMILNLILSIYMLVSIKNKFEIKNILIIPNKNILKEIFIYSFPIWLGSIVGVLNVQIDKLYIAKKLDIEALAIYTNMSKELPLAVISASIIVIITPHMVKYYNNGKFKNMINLWNSSIEICWIILSIAVIFLFVLSSETINILYSDQYLIGKNIFRVYLLLILLRVTYFGLILNVSNKTKYIAYYTIFTLIANIIFNIALFNFIGWIGPALATLISNFIVGGLQLTHSAKILKCKIREILPIKNMIIILLKCILVGIFISYLNKLFILLKINYLLRFIVLGIIYLIITLVIFLKDINRLRNLLV
ncbi:flippase [Clostridium perfringens A]|nr:polysaccharide biosynthesis protein [Clostridium perfringens]HBC2033170.1 polysaccharide biosynthesis protein [Clostridium perfringens]HBC2056577.1 polysaccharide biosynthesis protein [Clostridium perfringens]HBC2070697.1 polysaccharide biosynthesis protein [Clostridium perfringens]